jgi:hypothetical protein
MGSCRGGGSRDVVKLSLPPKFARSPEAAAGQSRRGLSQVAQARHHPKVFRFVRNLFPFFTNLDIAGNERKR